MSSTIRVGPRADPPISAGCDVDSIHQSVEKITEIRARLRNAGYFG
jgi:hypothetical protein